MKRASCDQPSRQVMKSPRNSNEAVIPHRMDFSALLSPLRALLLVVALMSGAGAVMILSRQRRFNQTATLHPTRVIYP